MSWYSIVRWIHVAAATGWFGEVLTINFVLVPWVVRMQGSEQARMLAAVFPRLFRLASYLSATAILTGGALFVGKFGVDWDMVLGTDSGRFTLIGATVGLALTTFHFILEPRLDGMICTAADNDDFEMTATIVRTLRIVPRVGLGVIGSALLLMMIGARGV